MIDLAITALCFCPPERSEGYFVHELLRRGEPDRLERLGDPAAALLRAPDPVNLERMTDRLLDRHRGVERRVRVLEDDLHLPPDCAKLALGHARDLASLELDAPLGRLDEPEQRSAERGLAAPRLADEPEHLALAKLERDVVHGLHVPRLAADEPLARSSRGSGSTSSGP